MSKSLFDLIKTLTKAEKRVFSEKVKSTKRKRYYLALISMYSKQEEYSSNLDQKIFKKESAKMISDCKIKCRKLLHEYLVTLENNKGVRAQIEQKYQVANMLINRNLTDEASKIIKKIEQLAVKYEMLEQLIKIRSTRIQLQNNIMASSFKVDLDYMKFLLDEKKKTIDQFVEAEDCGAELRYEFLKAHVTGGYIKNTPNPEQYSSNPVKNIKKTLVKLQATFFSTIHENKTLALEAVTELIKVTKENREVALSGRTFLVPYTIFLRVYVELSISCKSNLDIELVQQEFDSKQCHTYANKFNLIESKTVAYCLYSLYINDPAFSLPQIQENELFYEESKNQDLRYKISLENSLMVFFALKDWKSCHTYIDKIETFGVSEILRIKAFNLKLICVYEQNDLHYFNSLVERELVKRRKKRIKLKDCKDFLNCVFNFLYYLSKGSTGNYAASFKKINDSFDEMKPENRYFIHWIVYKFPELNNTDYQAFLEENKLQHYSFGKSPKQLKTVPQKAGTKQAINVS